ncbi:MAG: aminoacyl-tRNA hydrolase [bacterium]|nr:aminoacyl-tRNA hydrolase [bacterium]
MKLIVGLGNPGKKYESTRHNVGYAMIDALEKAWKGRELFFFLGLEKHKLYEQSEWEYRPPAGKSERVTLMKPRTFMNLSGDAAAFAIQHSPKSFVVKDDLWVVHDEIDISLGRVKLDRNRSAAGHNGIKSIIERIGTKDFIRFRVGIGATHSVKENLEQFVLKRFGKEEKEIMQKTLSFCEQGCEVLLDQDFESAQNFLNGRDAKNPAK